MKKYVCIGSIIFLLCTGIFIFLYGNLKISIRPVPIPGTISPQMQKFLSIPISPLGTLVTPGDTKQWRRFAKKISELATVKIEALSDQFSLTINKENIHGVDVYVITPPHIPDNRKNKILINAHGGGYVILPGKSGLSEALLMAHYAQTKVIAIDYRMPPDFPFPAALDDMVIVYQEIMKTYSTKDIALFGTSAGGGLIAATVLKFNELHIPLPAAIALITPWDDLTKTGDTYFTNAGIDNVVASYSGTVAAAAKLYTSSNDIKNPLISPIYGDDSQFPPTILISGTRDLLLSCTVRMHRKLRQQGVLAELHVFEAMPHAFQVLNPEAPESIEAWKEIVSFFQKQWG